MDILKWIDNILVEQDPQEKDDLLAQLSQVLESDHGLNEADIVEGVRRLLSAALREDNKAVRETFFCTIDAALHYHDIGTSINWDQLVPTLPSLDKSELEYVLDMLGFSGQMRYLPILEEYAHHTDSDIREWADDAIANLTF